MENEPTTDEQRTEVSKKLLSKAVAQLVEPDCDLRAVLVVSNGEGMRIIPLRLTQGQAFALLVAACTALEPEEAHDPRSLN